MRMTQREKDQMAVTRATATPLWKGIATLIKYRTVANHKDPEFLMQRFSDKLIFSILVATLYLGVGSDLEQTNYLNIGSVLVMWSILPAYGTHAAPPPPPRLCGTCMHAPRRALESAHWVYL